MALNNPGHSDTTSEERWIRVEMADKSVQWYGPFLIFNTTIVPKPKGPKSVARLILGEGCGVGPLNVEILSGPEELAPE